MRTPNFAVSASIASAERRLRCPGCDPATSARTSGYRPLEDLNKGRILGMLRSFPAGE
jgi:hypothetical protein